MPFIPSESTQGGWFVTASATPAVATKAGVAEKKQVATHITVDAAGAALVTLESPSGTILWQKNYAAAFQDSLNLPDETFVGPEGQAMVLRVSAGASHASLGGYQRE